VRHLGSLFPETTRLAASGGKATHLSVLHDGGADPVDTRVVADHLVVRVDADDFVELEGRVLVDPVRVEHTKVATLAADTGLGNAAVVALELEVLDTLVTRLTVDDTLGVGALAATTSQADAVDDVALLGLVSESSGLIRARRSGRTVDGRKLSVLPAANTQQKAQDIALLSLPQLLKIFVSSHPELPCFCPRF